MANIHVGVDSLSIALKNHELRKETADSRCWISDENVATLVRFSSQPPAWSFDLTDIQAAREFYGKQCADNNGAMISLEKISISGLEALERIFKYRAPASSQSALAMSFAGIIWLPFDNCSYQINVEAIEQGTTGLREAGVMLMRGKDVERKEPIGVTSGEALFGKMKASKLSVVVSDGVEYDAQFPSHPLSKVRRRLVEVLDTLRFTCETDLNPYRMI